MNMSRIWNDERSFNQHLEDMRIFRQSHHGSLKSSLTPLKDITPQSGIHPLNRTGGAGAYISTISKPAVVPIWEMVLPGNSQN